MSARRILISVLAFGVLSGVGIAWAQQAWAWQQEVAHVLYRV